MTEAKQLESNEEEIFTTVIGTDFRNLQELIFIKILNTFLIIKYILGARDATSLSRLELCHRSL